MKKAIYLLLILILAASLAACNTPDNPEATAIPALEDQSRPEANDHLEPDEPENHELSFIDVEDWVAGFMASHHMWDVIYTGVTETSWTDPNTVNVYSLMMMFVIANQDKHWGGDDHYYVEQSIVEEYIQNYFAVSTERLRTADSYISEKESYRFEPFMGWGMGADSLGDPEVMRTEYYEESKILILYITNPDYMSQGGEHPELAGEVWAALSIQIEDDGSFKYIGNELLPLP